MRTWLIAGLVGCGCLLDNPEFDGPSGHSGNTTTSGDDDGPVDDTTATGSSTGGPDAGDGGDGGGESGTGDDSGTTGLPQADMGLPAEQEQRLKHYGDSACNEPLWCALVDDLYEGVGGPIWVQECFEADLPAPLRIEEVHYFVAATMPELGPFELQVFTSVGGKPGLERAQIQLYPAVDATIGEHTLIVDPPIELDSSAFCVGFGAEGGGLTSALGVGIDSTSTQPDVSFVKLGNWPGCVIPSFTDVFEVAQPPVGNWCIDVLVSAD